MRKFRVGGGVSKRKRPHGDNRNIDQPSLLHKLYRSAAGQAPLARMLSYSHDCVFLMGALSRNLLIHPTAQFHEKEQ